MATARRQPRPTIGLVTANIHLGVGATLWSGVLEAAERNDVNVLCFPGGALRPEGADGAARNALYRLISPEHLDGAICWTSTLGLPAPGTVPAARLTERLAALPAVVSLNRALEDHETLLLDSNTGMRRAVGHLTGEHGRRRLACLRGPLANPVSVDRFRAYTDALARHHIPYDRALVTASVDFAPGAGAAAMRVLLDVRGLRPGRDFDAVIACSDALAADALRFLTHRGIRVPEDVALISFNDSVEARISDPPLTSVALPFGELGALAVDTLLARLRGTAPPTRRAVPGTLVIRRSCGCHSPLVSQGEPRADGGPFTGNLGDDPGHDPGEGPAEDLALPRALAELAPALREEAGGTAFLAGLERLIGSRIHSYEQAAVWDRALLAMRARGPMPGDARRERLLGQARLMVADKAQRLLEYERWTKEQEARRLQELATALTTVTDTAALTAALDRQLPPLGVPRAELLLGGTPELAAVDRALPAAQRWTAVLEPLHIGSEHLGFALFTAGPRRVAARHGGLFRALGDQISAALKGVRLFEEVRRARDAAERASRGKTRLLDDATDELRTPVEAILRHLRPGDPGHADAARLLLLIDDLLDLSRSEIDALDLDRQLLDPRPLLIEMYGAGCADLPRRLPAIAADPARLRQILGNLRRAAAGPGSRLTADVRPPYLVLRLTAPALRPAPGETDQLFQPFATGEPGSRLGLAIARRLAVLHGGALGFADGAFVLQLPLPAPPPDSVRGAPPADRAARPGRTLLIATSTAPPPELTALARRHGLLPHRLHPDDDLATLTAAPGPAAIAWDTAHARPQEWSMIRRLHDHPALRHTPFLLYGGPGSAAYGRPDLHSALTALRPPGLTLPALIATASPSVREELRRLATAVLPGRTVRAAADGTTALALLAEEAGQPPALLITDRVLPDMDGFDLVDQARELTGAPAATPVLMLSDDGFTAADVRRAEPHPGLVLLGREVLTGPETVALLTAMTQRTEPAPAPVRAALAYLEAHYRERITRWQVAQAAGVSEDHLGRLFHREIGLTLWDYLTRLRIRRARTRLRNSDDNIRTIARAVGFHDRAYFTRVFRRHTGHTPHAYRDGGREAGG
ncbi:substrate-binding domain-containing protein [Streptomyces xiamenensis]|uniref:substrate-binding domain-containing protein n=1 Tax=Streptomyces xiamenensis TaxID=408015 RepID=UPI0034438F5A